MGKAGKGGEHHSPGTFPSPGTRQAVPWCLLTELWGLPGTALKALQGFAVIFLSFSFFFFF